MEKKKYYTVIYETMYPDSGVITYRPINVIKGFYDVDNEIFIEEETNKEYQCVNIAVPNFGNNEDHIMDALSNEIVEYAEENERFFAFPIEETDLIDYCEKDELDENVDLKELYERETRGFLLYSIYDSRVDDNIYFVADKLESHLSYMVDVSLDLISAIEDSEVMTEINQTLFLILSADDFDNVVEEDDKDNEAVHKKSREEQLRKESAFTEIISDFDPDDLEEKVCSEVIAQNHVAKALVSMIYKNKKYHDHNGLKSNMLILGPSGCGKTELARSIQRNTGIPTVFFDASSASASGYVGNSVTQAIRDLLTTCGGDLELAENGIIVIDEIDKLTGGEGISKGDVQDELFKMLEGDEITVSAENYRDKPFRFNPKNVTFIGCGAAQSLIEKKKKEKNKVAIGFGKAPAVNPNVEEDEVVIEPEDLITYGFKPELLRRFPIIKVVKNLSKDKLVDLLTKSKISNLKLYEKAFNDVDHVKLIYDKDVLEEIASRAMKEKAGASGLKRVVDDMLQVAVRKIRLLKGESGELRISKETLDDPEKFQLYKLSSTSDKKELVYPPPEKVKVKVKKAIN